MKFKIQNTEFKTPESWDEVTVEQYQLLQLALLNSDLDEDDKQIAIIGILCSIPDELLGKGSRADFKHVYNNSLQFAVTTEPEADIHSLITIDGIQYYFDVDFEKTMPNDMYTDFKFLKKEPIVNLHKLMAIFIRPVLKPKFDFHKWKGIKKQNYISGYIAEEYNTESLEQRANILKKCSINKVYGVTVFFWTLSTELLKIMSGRVYTE